jgi:hypothetical protein
LPFVISSSGEDEGDYAFRHIELMNFAVPVVLKDHVTRIIIAGHSTNAREEVISNKDIIDGAGGLFFGED